MRIEDLEVFVATAQSEIFFTSTGEPHRFNSSAAKEILRLEEEFGSLLFLREGTNSGILTEAGKALFRQSAPLIKQYHKVLRSMDRFRDKDQQQLIIGTLPILKQYRLNRVFDRFIRDHEGINIRMEETDGRNLIDGLADDYYDAIVIRKNMLAGMKTENYRLASDEMMAILWEDHRFAHQSAVDITDLKNEFFYLNSPYTSSYGTAWKLLKDNHISTENVRTSSVDQILPAVAAHQGVALLPVSTLMVSQQPGLVAVPLNPRVTLEVVFAMRRGGERSATFLELIDLIKTRARKVPQ